MSEITSDQFWKLSRDLEIIKKLLITLHSNEPLNNHHWIEGFAVGSTVSEGLNGVRGVYVLLYGIGEQMKNPNVKVYKSESYNLPAFIRDAVNWDKPDDYPSIEGRSAEKGNLIKRGQYIECPRFSIIRHSGEETETGPQRKLACVVQMSRDAEEAEKKALAARKASAQPAQPAPKTQPSQPAQPAPKAQQQPAPKAQQPAQSTPKTDNPFDDGVTGTTDRKQAEVLTAPEFASRIDAIQWSVNVARYFQSQADAETAYDGYHKQWKPKTQAEMLDKFGKAIVYLVRRAKACDWAVKQKAYADTGEALNAFESLRKVKPNAKPDELFQEWKESCLLLQKERAKQEATA